jgi:hypothetical protein
MPNGMCVKPVLPPRVSRNSRQQPRVAVDLVLDRVGERLQVDQLRRGDEQVLADAPERVHDRRAT